MILFAVMAGRSAHAEEAEARLIREAKELFQFIKTDERHPVLERCGISADWDTTPLPDYVAREQFGITVHAGLSAPIQNSTPAEVLDLGVAVDNVFCSAEKMKKYVDEKSSLVKSGQSEHESIRSSGYTFPILNAGYTKAIVIYTGSLNSWSRNNSDVHHMFDFGVTALVYSKIKGHWRKTNTIELAVT